MTQIDHDALRRNTGHWPEKPTDEHIRAECMRYAALGFTRVKAAALLGYSTSHFLGSVLTRIDPDREIPWSRRNRADAQQRDIPSTPTDQVVILRDAVLSECQWLTQDSPTARAAVARYVDVMAAQPSDWWRARADKSLRWWLGEIEAFVGAGRAAA